LKNNITLDIIFTERNFEEEIMKVGIIGIGSVGSSIAHGLTLREHVSEVVLLDLNSERVDAESIDISHGTSYFSSTTVRRGTYRDMKQMDVIVITAGAPQKPGQTRLDLVKVNAEIYKDIFSKLKPQLHKESLLIIVSNPVDVMTMVAKKLSGLKSNQVIGTGTMLDTARLKDVLSKHTGISAGSIEGYVLGEHGDSEIVAWSCMHIGGATEDCASKQIGCACTPTLKKEMAIVNKKGATWFGISSCVVRLIEAISKDEKNILPLSVMGKELFPRRELSISLPRVIGRKGVLKTVIPDLSKAEITKLKSSADVIYSTYKKLKI